MQRNRGTENPVCPREQKQQQTVALPLAPKLVYQALLPRPVRTWRCLQGTGLSTT